MADGATRGVKYLKATRLLGKKINHISCSCTDLSSYTIYLLVLFGDSFKTRDLTGKDRAESSSMSERRQVSNTPNSEECYTRMLYENSMRML